MDMDEFVWTELNSSCDPPFQESSAVSHHQQPALEFMSCDDVPEQWLLDDDVLDKHDDEDTRDGRRAIQLPPPPPLVQTTRGGRKPPGPRTDGHASSHVEAERQRRDRLNRRFCELRAAVPRVTRMDKPSILGDAVAYIVELRGRVEQLEKASLAPHHSTSFGGSHDRQESMALEARMIGPEAAALRLRTTAAAAAECHAPARLMAARRSGRWTCPCSTRACAAWVGSPCRTSSWMSRPPGSGETAGSARRSMDCYCRRAASSTWT